MAHGGFRCLVQCSCRRVILALAAGACGGNSGAATPPVAVDRVRRRLRRLRRRKVPVSLAPQRRQRLHRACSGSGTGSPRHRQQSIRRRRPSKPRIRWQVRQVRRAAPASATAAVPAVATPASATANAATARTGAPGRTGAAPLSPEAARRQAEIEWALKQDEIKNDKQRPMGGRSQSLLVLQRRAGHGAVRAGQATGVPNVESLGNNGMAWSPKTAGRRHRVAGADVREARVRHRRTHPRIDWTGRDHQSRVVRRQGRAPRRLVGLGSDEGIDYLIVEFPRTAFKTDRVRMTLATNIVSGWQADRRRPAGRD